MWRRRRLGDLGAVLRTRKRALHQAGNTFTTQATKWRAQSMAEAVKSGKRSELDVENLASSILILYLCERNLIT